MATPLQGQNDPASDGETGFLHLEQSSSSLTKGTQSLGATANSIWEGLISTLSPASQYDLQSEKQRQTELLKTRLQEMDASLVQSLKDSEETQAQFVKEALELSQTHLEISNDDFEEIKLAASSPCGDLQLSEHGQVDETERLEDTTDRSDDEFLQRPATKKQPKNSDLSFDQVIQQVEEHLLRDDSLDVQKKRQSQILREQLRDLNLNEALDENTTMQALLIEHAMNEKKSNELLPTPNLNESKQAKNKDEQLGVFGWFNSGSSHHSRQQENAPASQRQSAESVHSSTAIKGNFLSVVEGWLSGPNNNIPKDSREEITNLKEPSACIESTGEQSRLDIERRGNTTGTNVPADPALLDSHIASVVKRPEKSSEATRELRRLRIKNTVDAMDGLLKEARERRQKNQETFFITNHCPQN
eukprot:Nitzschia sp. Nitz4//scaffold272_size25479//16880//18188//NITZ4_008310-RA/size25479-snap-gene-0.3-mRNA-1//-1//CDS//3329545228//3238//frame0